MVRYYEVTVDPQFKAESDFIHRKRNASIWRTITYYLLGLLSVLGLYVFRYEIGGDFPFVVFTSMILTLLTLSSVVTVQKNLDLVTAIEFQNALFSSAFREGKLFSMIVSQDDQMYYADPGFYKTFPELLKNSGQVLDAIVKNAPDPANNLAKLNKALLTRQQESLDIYLKLENKPCLARLSIIPLPRPSGYFFVSARRFELNRNHDSKELSVKEQSEFILNLFLEHVEDATYILNREGELIKCSQALVDMLGYEDTNDLHGKALTELLFNYTEKDPQLFASSVLDQEKVNFRKKSGALLQANISHKHVHTNSKSGAFTFGKVMFLS